MNILALTLLFALMYLSGCSSNAPASEAKAEAAKTVEPVVVQTAVAESRIMPRSIPVTGSLLPDETVSISSEVPGRVTAVFVDFGQSVRKGQVVAELDSRELSLQLDRARAALAQALARIGLDPKEQEKIPESTPAIRQAQAQLEEAKFKFESAERLLKTGDISRERHTELEKTYRARLAAYEAARDDLRTQLANIQALQAEVRLAQKRLSDTVLRAPFDGSVSEKLVSPGQYIKENTPILTVVKTDPMRLRFDVPEPATGSVRLGTSLVFTTDAAPGKEFRAVVRELNPSLDPRSRALTVEARLLDSDKRLRPGSFVQVRLIVEKDAKFVMVPRRALFSVAGLTKLFTVEGDKVREHRVNPGVELGDWVEIPGGAVAAGDRVVTSKLSQLVDGTRVKVETTAAGKG